MNQVILIGRLTKTPDQRYTPNGTAVTTFTLAVDKPTKDKDADFINCVAWNKLAETVANYCTKGKQVAVAGRISTRNYENSDGKKVYVTEVTVTELKFLSENKPAQEQPTGNLTAGSTVVEYDDIPF